MISLYSKIVRQISKAIVFSKRYNALENHYIFADPRGGSTWLMEMIHAITKEPVIWEPLQLELKDNPFKSINFGRRQHIPEASQWNEAKEMFDELFQGNLLLSRLYEASLSEVITSRSLIFKICRGSALLPWLTYHYDFKFKPIYLIRHPFAVVNSQLDHGAWNYNFTKFNIPETPFNMIYKEHQEFLKTITTKEEALVAEWCLANNEPLAHKFNNIKWLTLNYEEFVMNPERSLARILASWGIQSDISSIDFSKNSSTTKDGSPEKIKSRISRWQNNLDKSQLERMGSVLDYFKTDVYSKENPLPEKVFNYG